ncbi:MAG: BspA family leucine-rich repeat surface protein, partial [Clostridiales bacterium]|nr:BspA family leucine-rich repeat surface protein [Clostridiales bacterium]
MNFGDTDDSTNYLAYPTLMALPRQAVDALEEELQRLQFLAADLEAELQRLQARAAEYQQLLAQVLARKEELQAQLAQARSRGSRMADAGGGNGCYSLDGLTYKSVITEIRFLNTLKTAPANAADLSEAKDRSVLCWTEGTVQRIAGKGGVVAGRSCKKLFSGYKKVTTISFDGNFDTSRVTDMSSMFDSCIALTSLDLSGFDTSSVTDMSFMFNGCSVLTSLNLSGFNTSCVTSMDAMFQNCTALSSLNLSGFDTS